MRGRRRRRGGGGPAPYPAATIANIKGHCHMEEMEEEDEDEEKEKEEEEAPPHPTPPHPCHHHFKYQRVIATSRQNFGGEQKTFGCVNVITSARNSFLFLFRAREVGWSQWWAKSNPDLDWIDLNHLFYYTDSIWFDFASLPK